MCVCVCVLSCWRQRQNELLATSYSRTYPPPCQEACRRQCCSWRRSTTWLWQTSCGARSRAAHRTWSSVPDACAGTSGKASGRTCRNSSWPRISWARSPSASRTPQSPPSMGTGNTGARLTSRCTSARTPRSAWPGTSGLPGCAPPNTGSNNITDTNRIREQWCVLSRQFYPVTK